MNSSFIPPFDADLIFRASWMENHQGWVVLMGFLVATACGLIGNYLILRRMALVGDAISHSVLPGIVIAYLIAHSRNSFIMLLGALAAGMATTILIEFIHRRTRVKQDAAIGIVFSTLFAIGVILINVFARKVDLDADCVLYGELGYVAVEPAFMLGSLALPPERVCVMGIVTLTVILLVVVFYRELLVSSFDPGLGASLGISPTLVHYSLMCMLSIVVVSAFESVGSILVVAMLILPGATSMLLTTRLPFVMVLSVVHSALSAVLGMHMSIWLGVPTAAAMVVCGAILFIAAWIFAPNGLLAGIMHSEIQTPPPEETDPATP